MTTKTLSVLLPRPQGRKRGSHALLEGQERMISLQIQKVARTGENPSLAALHRKIAAACRKRRLPITSSGTVLRRLRAYDARISRGKLERPTRSQSTVQRFFLTLGAKSREAGEARREREAVQIRLGHTSGASVSSVD
jgi:hypothetical protein